MFDLNWTPRALSDFESLQKHGTKKKGSRQAGTYKQLVKCLKFLADNPRHPGLRTHPYP